MDVDNQPEPQRSELPGRVRAAKVRQFILQTVEQNPSSIARTTADAFGISRQAVNRQLARLVGDGLLTVSGVTKGRLYTLRILASEHIPLDVTPDVHEDEVWTKYFARHTADLPPSVQRICYYGFTEMLNNVLDHSESPQASLTFKRNAIRVEVEIYDHGVGIFNKIQEACQLETPHIAVFELTKGKFTTDPQRHTGEGIFFTSRVFDSFAILSGTLYLAHSRGKKDWLLESRANQPGTSVFLKIASNSTHTIEEVLTHYATEQDDYAFNKTTIAIALAVSLGEQLVSRSQAKRVSARLDRFKEVVLDFQGIASIGPAFADELFRVFQTQHPHVSLIPINANEEVTRMIRRVIAGTASDLDEPSQKTPD